MTCNVKGSIMQRKTDPDASIPVKSRIQERIDRVHWYHEFDFGNGLRAEVKTPDAQSHRRLWRFIQSELDKIDFTGKSVLDIGCWDGYWSFYAERKGAARVLATDDSSQNWTGGAGFHLAKELLNSSVESDLQLSIYDLCRLDTKFDIILCLGVLYHLLDPFYGLVQIRHRCHPNSIIILEGDVFFGLIESREQSAALYSRDVRRAPRFVPDPDTLRFLVNATYFTITTESVFPLSTTTDAEILRGVNRMLLACQPFYGRNMCHEYQPPFGLKEYDSRAGVTPERWSDLYLGPGEEV
jgi:tRNA (mo5U34)-methyltransferase